MTNFDRLDAAAQDLVRIKDVCERYPKLKKRTLEVWIQKAEPQTMTIGGREVAVPGTPNGLAPAIVRKGRMVYIRLSLFLAWWLEGSTDALQAKAS